MNISQSVRKLSGGHLFLTQGDVTGLACDAILVPSGTAAGPTGKSRPGHVMSQWHDVLGDAQQDGFLRESPDESRKVIKVDAAGGITRPALWAGFTGDRGDEPVDFFTEAVDAFVQEAARDAAGGNLSDPRPLGTSRPLLALPLIGSGAGGMRDDAGQLLSALIKTLVMAADRTGADVVLVLSNERAFAAAQHARALVEDELVWGDLSDWLHEEALRLAGLARRQRLVAFLGAGASVGAGLPSWSELIARLGADAGLTRLEQEELARLDPRDAGAVLDKRLREGGRSLGTAVIQSTEASRCSLLHQLLASLPMTEAVTTNYDNLFEQAWDAVGAAYSVLPTDSRVEEGRWLLKLHGSAESPDRIVLSRDDYLRFEGDGVALAGLVQAMLLTRHMLFVGFSLSDENFHRLVHQVRAALGSVGSTHRTTTDESDGRHRFGTALTPRALSLRDDLWSDSIHFVSTAAPDATDNPRGVAIFLDRVAALAAAPALHLVDEAYDALLSRAQRELRRRLIEVQNLLGAGELDEATRQAVSEALRQVGLGRTEGGRADVSATQRDLLL